MDDVVQTKSNDGMLKNASRMQEEAVAEERVGGASGTAHGEDEEAEETRARRRPWARKRKSYSHAHFKVYKRRWFGLAQLVLLNVVVSWDVSHLCSQRRLQISVSLQDI
jgi:FLVCR family MFS transporter 7